MAEFQIKIINGNRITVAETYVSGESQAEVLESLRELIESAEDGSDEWADGIAEDLG
jgi:hypothetical protein